MQLSRTLAAAAAVSAVANYVPSGNYTRSPHASIASTASAAAFATGAVDPASASVTSEVLVELEASLKFEIKAGACAWSGIPPEAAHANLCAIRDLDDHVEGTFRIRVCEPKDNGRVITKVQGKYIYGLAVHHKVLASGAVEVVCDNGDLTKYRIENNVVAEVELDTKIITEPRVHYKCENAAKCQRTTCEGDKCASNLVIKIDAPAQVPARANATVTLAPVYKFEECQPKPEVECSCIKTCIADKCEVQKPAKGPAPAPLPAAKVAPKLAPAPAPAGNKEVQHRPNQPSVAPPAAAPPAGPTPKAVNGTAVPQVAGSARVAIAFNFLAGVVAVAFF